jgi:23S rRNA pseudouridine1911/1915/1917 synthase
MSKFRFQVTEKDEGRSIKDILRNEFVFSRRLRIKLKQQPELVRLNGAPAEGWFPVHPGDQITIEFPQEQSRFEPENIPLDILFEDEDFLLLNKQPGIVCHPTKGHPSHTLSNGIQFYMEQTGQSFKVRFVSRLDMDTSGILAVAKNSHCQDNLIRQMGEKKITKRYMAVVEGQLETLSGTIRLPIGQPNPEKVQRGVVAHGADSITHYRVLECFPKGYTLLELTLETGRTHQIRVHLAHLGHPIVGDHLYGQAAPSLIERQALHASSLSFIHPVKEQPMEISAPLPEDMARLLKKLI